MACYIVFATALIAIGGAAALIAVSGKVMAASLAESVRLAVTGNPEIDIVRANRRAVEQQLRQASAGYLPSLDVTGSAGPEYVDSVTTRNRGPGSTGSAEQMRVDGQIRLSQMLFDGFETPSEVARQRARLGSASYRVQETAETIGVDAAEAHLDVLRNLEIVALNERNVETHERLLDQVQRLERSGAGPISDLRQAEARLARAIESRTRAQGSLADAIAFYERVVGLPPEVLELDEPPLAALPPGREAAAGAASLGSPPVLIAAADIDAAEAALRAARAGYYPRFDVELSAEGADDAAGIDGHDVRASALVVMRYNLFRGGGDVAREREAFQRLNEARAQLLRARRRAEEEARVSYNAFETARRRVEALIREAEAQRQTRDAYLEEFQIGRRDLLDVLDGENELFIARAQLVTARYTERFAVYRLLGVLGALLDTLDISPPAEADSAAVARAQTPQLIGDKSLPPGEPPSRPWP
ncbi:TolC family outer membrane protein [Geminicoccaceae bacterium 1502E]|nr:TolC family outer membrane protein [Geminicoccaceae bacterium 1502E]